ncbi:MAG: periplasmic polysaccharide biosynthesis/export protein [Desulfobulbus sp.]|nr:MAG: periplasmic polysaccharide biosynthesis/export protein [Desulfobulbus sp.]
MLKKQNIYSVTIAFILSLVTGVYSLRADDYTIGSGDVLTITVYDHPELKNTVRVSDNGNIVYPLIGEVHVGELKIPEAASKITSMLGDGYIIKPQVNIFIEQFKSKKAIILGQVLNPGLIELQGPTSLLELISQAGGLKDSSGETAIIKREVKGKQQTIKVDLHALIERGDAAQNLQIFGGDTVSISKQGSCYITGEVNQPNAYPCGKGTTLLKLISLAGGFNGKASDSSIKIIRVINGKKKIFKDVELNTALQADDIIIVPESFF